MHESTMDENVPDIASLAALRIRAAKESDARHISDLIRSLSAPFLLSPNGEGAEPFFASISESAIRGYIAASNFLYLVAEADQTIRGVVALRDNSHLFHLFVAPELQRQGLARRLWFVVRDAALRAGNGGRFTVNSSLNAVELPPEFRLPTDGINP